MIFLIMVINLIHENVMFRYCRTPVTNWLNYSDTSWLCTGLDLKLAPVSVRVTYAQVWPF